MLSGRANTITSTATIWSKYGVIKARGVFFKYIDRKKARAILILYAMPNFQPSNSASMVGEDKLRFNRFIKINIMILATPRQHWKRETYI